MQACKDPDHVDLIAILDRCLHRCVCKHCAHVQFPVKTFYIQFLQIDDEARFELQALHVRGFGTSYVLITYLDIRDII